MNEKKTNPQTAATERWRKKAGIKSKCFKLREPLILEFSKACERKGETQNQVITRLMEDYIGKEKRKMIKIYIVRDKEAGNPIDVYLSEAGAISCIERFEEEDKAEGTYTEEFYEIAVFEVE